MYNNGTEKFPETRHTSHWVCYLHLYKYDTAKNMSELIVLTVTKFAIK